MIVELIHSLEFQIFRLFSRQRSPIKLHCAYMKILGSFVTSASFVTTWMELMPFVWNCGWDKILEHFFFLSQWICSVFACRAQNASPVMQCFEWKNAMKQNGIFIQSYVEPGENAFFFNVHIKLKTLRF